MPHEIEDALFDRVNEPFRWGTNQVGVRQRAKKELFDHEYLAPKREREPHPVAFALVKLGE